jgi:hypothetical protein
MFGRQFNCIREEIDKNKCKDPWCKIAIPHSWKIERCDITCYSRSCNINGIHKCGENGCINYCNVKVCKIKEKHNRYDHYCKEIFKKCKIGDFWHLSDKHKIADHYCECKNELHLGSCLYGGYMLGKKWIDGNWTIPECRGP